MLQAILTLNFLIFLVCSSLCQSIEDLTRLNIYSKDSFQLFDINTIEKLNIKRAFVVRISREFDHKGRRLANDTCFVYEFNDRGIAMRRINFYDKRIYGIDWTDTLALPLPDEPYPTYRGSNRVINTTLVPAGKIVTEYLVRKYEDKVDSTFKVDTTFIIKTKYNLQNRKIEEEIIPSALYLKSVTCWDGWHPPSHYKYGYDKKGRLNLYRDCLSNELISISYPSYGELIKRFNATTNQLIAESVNTIRHTEDSNSIATTITTPQSQVIISKRKSNKNLVDMITVVENSSFPEIKYYQITYK
jgi:hypothetical protein